MPRAKRLKTLALPHAYRRDDQQITGPGASSPVPLFDAGPGRSRRQSVRSVNPYVQANVSRAALLAGAITAKAWTCATTAACSVSGMAARATASALRSPTFCTALRVLLRVIAPGPSEVMSSSTLVESPAWWTGTRISPRRRHQKHALLLHRGILSGPSAVRILSQWMDQFFRRGSMAHGGVLDASDAGTSARPA